jgi:hypothetical protein
MSLSIGEDIEQCPTCGQSVRIATTAEGTSYYVGVAEVNADVAMIRVHDHDHTLEQIRLYAEQLARSSTQGARMVGADILQLLGDERQ